MALWAKPARWGVLAAFLVFALDQASKTWLIHGYDMAARGRVAVLPVLDLVMAWNFGISYGLFQQNSLMGQYALVAFKIIIALALIIWLARTPVKIVALALGLLIGGALGNALDRVIYGAVADFFSLHFAGYYWYVFNIADVAIVAGVGLLLYDSFFPSQPMDDVSKMGIRDGMRADKE